MSAQLLYKMIKSKTEYPLHKAIKVEREDVVFLYLIEMDSQVSALQTASNLHFLLCYKRVSCFLFASVVFSYLASLMNWTTMGTWH